MTRNETRFLFIALAICLVFAGCGKKKDLGVDVDMGLQGTGLILGTDVASCVDKADATTKRSNAKYSMVFGNFSLTYRGVGKTLFVGSITITVTSPNIKNGSQVITMASDEIEYLLGSEGQTVTVPSGSTSVTVNSNSSDRSAAFPSCQFTIGGLSLVDPNVSFTATVDVEMVGSAANNTTGEVERVEEKITARAEY